MHAPTTWYPVVDAWLDALAVVRHRTKRQALTSLLTALLVAQSLRPASLMRALPSPSPVPARQRYKRLARLGPHRAPVRPAECVSEGAVALDLRGAREDRGRRSSFATGIAPLAGQPAALA